MTHEEFQREMDRLVDQWPRAYSGSRMEVIAREVADQTAAWWKRTVDRFLGERKDAPLLPEIRDVVARDRERSWTSQKSVPWKEFIANPFSCSRCGGSGVIRARLIGHEPGLYTYAFSCECEYGRKDRRGFPSWERADHSAFEIVR